MSLGTYHQGFDEDALYELKYQILSKRCSEVKNETDKIYERLLRCKRMLGKVLYERRALRDKLERQYHDKLSQAEVPAFREEDFAYEVLISQKQAMQSSACSSSVSSDVGLSNQSLAVSKSGKSSKLVVPSQMLLFGDGNSSNLINNAAAAASASCNNNGGNRRLSNVAKTGRKANARSNNNNCGINNSGPNGGGLSAPMSRKDPDAPRKPVNAYFIFCEKKRSLVQRQLSNEQSGEVDRKEVTRRLGQMWGALTDDEKNIYFDEYRRDKERYGIEMEEYTISKQRPIGLDETGIFLMSDLSAPSTSASLCSSSAAGPSKPKKAKRSSKSKLKSSTNNCYSRTPSASNLQQIPSSAPSPIPMLHTTASSNSITPQDDSALLLPYTINSTGYGDFFRGFKVEQGIMGNNSVPCFYGQLDNVSSPSSLAPTIGEQCPNYEKSPLTSYVHPPPLFVTSSEDATDEVFLSGTAHLKHSNLIESPPPGVSIAANNSSSGEGSFEMLQKQQQPTFNNMHSVAMQQLFLHHQSGINEMPVP